MSDYEIAFLQWLKYFVDTEIFDRRQPGHMSEHGEWIPVGEGYRLSVRSATKKRNECLGLLEGLDRDLVRAARREAERVPFERAIEILRRPIDDRGHVVPPLDIRSY